MPDSLEPMLQQTLVDIATRLTRIEVKLERAAEDRDSMRRLEERVVRLEGFQAKILGAVLAAGAMGGALGAIVPMLL